MNSKVSLHNYGELSKKISTYIEICLKSNSIEKVFKPIYMDEKINLIIDKKLDFSHSYMSSLHFFSNLFQREFHIIRKAKNILDLNSKYEERFNLFFANCMFSLITKLKRLIIPQNEDQTKEICQILENKKEDFQMFYSKIEEVLKSVNLKKYLEPSSLKMALRIIKSPLEKVANMMLKNEEKLMLEFFNEFSDEMELNDKFNAYNFEKMMDSIKRSWENVAMYEINSKTNCWFRIFNVFFKKFSKTFEKCLSIFEKKYFGSCGFDDLLSKHDFSLQMKYLKDNDYCVNSFLTNLQPVDLSYERVQYSKRLPVSFFQDLILLFGNILVFGDRFKYFLEIHAKNSFLAQKNSLVTTTLVQILNFHQDEENIEIFLEKLNSEFYCKIVSIQTRLKNDMNNIFLREVRGVILNFEQTSISLKSMSNSKTIIDLMNKTTNHLYKIQQVVSEEEEDQEKVTAYKNRRAFDLKLEGNNLMKYNFTIFDFWSSEFICGLLTLFARILLQLEKKLEFGQEENWTFDLDKRKELRENLNDLKNSLLVNYNLIDLADEETN